MNGYPDGCTQRDHDNSFWGSDATPTQERDKFVVLMLKLKLTELQTLADQLSDEALNELEDFEELIGALVRKCEQLERAL